LVERFITPLASIKKFGKIANYSNILREFYDNNASEHQQTFIGRDFLRVTLFYRACE